MSRYIDADKLIEEFGSLEQLARKRVYDTPTNSPAYERYSTQYCEREKALSIIKAQHTADVVEVVRCKECKHYKSGECRYHSEPKEMRMYERWTVDVNENDYCSYGERRGKKYECEKKADN